MIRRRLADRYAAADTAVDIARRFFEAPNAGDITEVLAVTDPNVILMPATRPARTVYVGHEGVRDLLGDLHNAFGYFRVHCDELIELDQDQIEVHGHALLGGGRRIEFASAVTVRNGRVTSLETADRHNPSD